VRSGTCELGWISISKERSVSELRPVVDMMALAALTAPKVAGKDFVVVRIIEGDDVVVLTGLRDVQSVGLSCGACGVDICELLLIHTFEEEFCGPQCAFRLLDMGIALGSAVKTASILNADNRIMYRAGVMARQLGMIVADFVMGILLSATGKRIYFNR
jgi:uncharacterized ferredoxin-like protein